MLKNYILLALFAGLANQQISYAFTEKINLHGDSIVEVGKHPFGKKVLKNVKLVNDTPKLINIRAIKNSCGCIKILKAPASIKPFESDELEFEIDILGNSGPFSTTLLIFLDDQHNSVRRIKVTGTFEVHKENLFASPDIVNLGDVQQGEIIKRTIIIYRNGWVPVGPLKVLTPDNSVRLISQEKSSSRIRLHFGITVPFNDRVFHKEILVQSNKKDDFIRIPLWANVLPSIRLTPNKVLVVPEKEKYVFLINSRRDIVPKLCSYEFQSNTLCMLSLKENLENKNQLVVELERHKDYTGFASGRLLLQYEGESEPIEAVFVSPTLSL